MLDFIFVIVFAISLSVFWLLWRMGLRHWNPAVTYRMTRSVRTLSVILSLGIALQFAPGVIRSEPVLVMGLKMLFIANTCWILERLLGIILFRAVDSGAISETTRSLLRTIGLVLLFIVGALVAIDSLGISITPVLASLGVGSLAIALALQDTLANFFSGIYLMVDKPIRIGDYVQVEDGLQGMVTRIGWRSTHIQMTNNNTIVMPNSKIASSKLINYDYPEQEMNFSVQLGVSYACDLNQVEAVTLEVAKNLLKNSDGAVADFQPWVRFHTFADSSIQFTVTLRCRQFVDQALVKHDFIKALHQRFKEEKIEIPFPQQVVHSAPS
jgi:small-conductance mechanosensitive channel